jgi:hypothetical protein
MHLPEGQPVPEQSDFGAYNVPYCLLTTQIAVMPSGNHFQLLIA